MVRTMRCLGLALFAACLAPLPSGAEDAAVLEPAPQTLTGEVVDPAGFVKDGRTGPELIDQTYEAVDGGQTLALLDESTGSLYLFLADSPGEDPSGLVYDHVNQKVAVTGRVYERGGLRGIVATTVEPVEAPDAAPAPPDP